MGKKSRNMRNKKEEVVDLDDLLKKLLEISIEQIFILAVENLVIHSGYALSLSSAISTVLSCGRISGKKTNILLNISKNVSIFSQYGYNSKLEPNFTNIAKLAKCSMDGLIDMILKHESKPTKKDVIVFLLCSDYLLFEDKSIDNSDLDNIDLDDNMEKPKTGAPCLNINLGEILKQLPWLDLEPLLPRTGERICSHTEVLAAIIHSEKNVEDLQLIYDVCKEFIVKDNEILESRIGERQRQLKQQLELQNLKENLANIDEKKAQLYALYMTQERLYRIEKYNEKYKMDYEWKIKYEMDKKKYTDELKKLENQLSQLGA